MDLDPLLLSRIQFAVAVSFHILFPAFTIGLAAWLVVLEALWLKTGKAIYMDIALHWTKIFAVSFGMGVVSGVVLSYEFGTNWSELSRRGGNVIGPLMSYEVLTAFFLEAGFLGIMLFGVGIPWLVVALFTLLQRTTPGDLQGRTYSAIEVLVGTPQTVSIALGAAAIAFVDYRVLLLVEAAVVAAAGAWLLTRREHAVAAPH